MGKAEIIQHIGDGRYSVRLLFNDEYILFQTHRLQQRQRELTEAIEEAEAELEAVEQTEQETRETLDEAIKRLNGQVTEEAKQRGAAVVQAVAAAETAAADAATALTNAMIRLDAARAALPPEPPTEVLTQFDHASQLLGEAATALGDARDELALLGQQAAAIVSGLTADEPDLAELTEQIVAALIQAQTASSALSGATTALNSAGTALSAIDPPAGAEEVGTLLSQARANMDEAEQHLGEASDRRGAAAAALTALQGLLTPGGPEAMQKVQEALTAAQEAKTHADTWRAWVADRKEELAQAQAEEARLGGIATSETRLCWCIDLSEGLQPGRTVASLEIPGELARFNEVVLAAGSLVDREHEIDWQYARDGWFTPMEALSPQAWFYTLALLPGWQTFRPTFRCGIITAIAADGRATVFLTAPNDSSQRGLRVSPRRTDDSPAPLEHVVIKYMTCDAAAFAVGDEVVIRFVQQDAGQPEIIGFRAHPKPCGLIMLATPAAKLLPQGDPVTAWQTLTPPAANYGYVNWWNAEQGLEVSWIGPWGRYIWPRPYEDLRAEFYWQGKIVTCPGKVLGAALRKVANRLQGLCVTVLFDEEAYDGDGEITETLWLNPDVKRNQGAGAWQSLADHAYRAYEAKTGPGGTGFGQESYEGYCAWFFNQSATAAVSTKRYNAAEWQESDPPGTGTFREIDWQRRFDLRCPIDGEAEFTIAPAQSILPLWTLGNTADMAILQTAVDYRGDEEVSAHRLLRWEQRESPADAATFSVLVVEDWTLDLGGGWQIAGPHAGKAILALDLRHDPPTVVYDEIDQDQTPARHVPTWEVAGQTLPLGAEWTGGIFGHNFTNRFFWGRLVRDREATVVQWRQELCLLIALPKQAAGVVYPHHELVALWPDQILSALTGEPYTEALGSTSA